MSLKCTNKDHQYFGHICYECTPNVFCFEHERKKDGTPKSKQTCYLCSPIKYCSDPEHMKFRTKKIITAQACFLCYPSRFCDNPEHPRGRNGTPRSKVNCAYCSSHSYCFNKEHYTTFNVPIKKNRCRKCINTKKEQITSYFKVVSRVRVKKRRRKNTRPQNLKRKRKMDKLPIPVMKRPKPLCSSPTSDVNLTLNRLNLPKQKNILLSS